MILQKYPRWKNMQTTNGIINVIGWETMQREIERESSDSGLRLKLCVLSRYYERSVWQEWRGLQNQLDNRTCVLKPLKRLICELRKRKRARKREADSVSGAKKNNGNYKVPSPFVCFVIQLRLFSITNNYCYL